MSDDPDFRDEDSLPNGPWRDGKLWLMSAKCSTCIFRPGNLMHLVEGRFEQMVADCIANNTVIPCHKTLDGLRAVCRGLWDAHYRDISILQIADRLGVVAHATSPEGH